MSYDGTFTSEEVKTLFAKHAGKLVLWTAAITFVLYLHDFYYSSHVKLEDFRLQKTSFIQKTKQTDY